MIDIFLIWVIYFEKWGEKVIKYPKNSLKVGINFVNKKRRNRYLSAILIIQSCL